MRQKRMAGMPWRSITKALGLTQSGDGGQGVVERMVELAGATSGTTADGRTRVAFTVAIIGLAAKLSKSDGVASAIEADTFFKVYPVPPGETVNVRRLFDLAKQDVAGFEHYAKQIAKLFRDAPQLKVDVLESLFHVAAADGILHGAEDRYLRIVAARFGLSDEQYASTRSQFIADASDPYVILGIRRSASNDEIKAHYRRLVKETHPDTMVQRGVPPELTAHANRKLAMLNAAYDQIARERGL